MNDHLDDLKRARALGITLEEFQRLVGYDPLDKHISFVQGGMHAPIDSPPKKEKKKKKKDKKPYSDAGYGKDNFPEIPSEHVPFETDEDVKNKDALELENYWTRPVTSDEDKALYYGFHIHSKDNVYGLHRHYPGGPLGGGHTHGAQNPQGYHTHRYSQEELLQFKFARPGVMIQLDGPHEHELNAPDGKHTHCEENFGPANSRREQQLKDRNALVDKNIISMHPKSEVDDLYEDD